MYRKRAIEKTILQADRTFKAILVTGARQVGKSTLLRHLFEKDDYYTFDDPLLRQETLREPGLFFRNHMPPVTLDEVQYISELFSYIKMECDRREEKGLIRMAGSQKYHLMKNISESLAGRVAILDMWGLSLREWRDDPFDMPFLPTENYLKERKETSSRCDHLWELIHRGSYPALLDQDVPWQTFFSSYVQTYIERDVNELTQIKDKLKFTQFLTVAATRTGQMLNYSSIADQLDISVSTVKEWISILETSGILYLLQPFSNSALTRAIKTPKLYFCDTGLACYLMRYPTPEMAMNGAMAGAIFETFVMAEIIKSYANVGIDYRMIMSYYRGKDKIRRKVEGGDTAKEAEIDLIIEQNGELWPVEIKMTANPRLDMTNAFDVLDRIPGKTRRTGTILCMYETPIWLSENTLALPVEYI